MKYIQMITLTSTAGVPSIYVFRGNSLFDPDYTSTGHQPYGFDQYASLYANYYVAGSKIKITPQDTVGAPTMITVLPYTAATPPTGTSSGAQWMAEVPYAKHCFSLYNYRTSLKSYMSTGKLFGYTAQEVNDDKDFWAYSSNNPGTQFYWIIAANYVSSAANSSTVCTVEITYYAKWGQRLGWGTS